MGQYCCCLGGTVEEEREVVPRAARRAGGRRVSPLSGEELGGRASVAEEEQSGRSALSAECARSGERAAGLQHRRECGAAEAAARAALEAAAERSLLGLAESWARGQGQGAELYAWGQLQAAAKAGVAAISAGVPRERGWSSGRDSEGSGTCAATPEASSIGEPPLSAAAHPPDDYEDLVVVGKLLGQGTFGVVYACEAKESGASGTGPDLPKEGALKVFATPEEDELRMQWALATVASLPPHANLVRVYCCGVLPEHKGRDCIARNGSQQQPLAAGSPLSYRWLVMSKAWGTMDFMISGSRLKGLRLRIKTLAAWMQQAAAGMAELHRHNLVHSDFKKENLLLVKGPEAGSYTCQICDVDSVHEVGATCRAVTAPYLDPFLYFISPRTTSFDWDVWSLGIAAHVVFTQGGFPPGMIAVFEAAERGEFVQLRAHQGLPALVGSVLEHCWKPQGERCTAGDFMTRCDPQAFNRAIKKGTPKYAEYEAVMHTQDHDFEQWMHARKVAQR